MEDNGSRAPLAEVREITKRYTRRHGNADSSILALDGVSLAVSPDLRIGLVGQSGSGKSTLARCLCGLEAPDSGEVLVEGHSLASISRRDLRRVRRSVQMLYQDSANALNPELTLREIIAEPLAIAGWKRQRSIERVDTLMELTGLAQGWDSRKSFELSGGERQRAAIARALAAEPGVLIFDETLSGLDLPLQAELVRMLETVRAESRLGFLFITHDLRLAATITDELTVLHAGKIVERNATEAVINNPSHPHTQSLLAAIPSWQRGESPAAGGTP